MYYFVFLRSSYLQITFFSCNNRKPIFGCRYNFLRTSNFYFFISSLINVHSVCTIACCKEKVSQWDHQPQHKRNVLKAMMKIEYLLAVFADFFWSLVSCSSVKYSCGVVVLIVYSSGTVNRFFHVVLLLCPPPFHENRSRPLQICRQSVLF